MSIFQYLAICATIVVVLFVVSVRHNLYWRWKLSPYRYCFRPWLVTQEGVVLKGRRLRWYKKLLRLETEIRKCNRAIKHDCDMAKQYRLARERNERALQYNALMRYSGYIFAAHQFLPTGEELMRRKFHYVETIKPRRHV